MIRGSETGHGGLLRSKLIPLVNPSRSPPLYCWLRERRPVLAVVFRHSFFPDVLCSTACLLSTGGAWSKSVEELEHERSDAETHSKRCPSSQNEITPIDACFPWPIAFGDSTRTSSSLSSTTQLAAFSGAASPLRRNTTRRSQVSLCGGWSNFLSSHSPASLHRVSSISQWCHFVSVSHRNLSPALSSSSDETDIRRLHTIHALYEHLSYRLAPSDASNPQLLTILADPSSCVAGDPGTHIRRLLCSSKLFLRTENCLFFTMFSKSSKLRSNGVGGLRRRHVVIVEGEAPDSSRNSGPRTSSSLRGLRYSSGLTGPPNFFLPAE
jgi:hypothetical protein